MLNKNKLNIIIDIILILQLSSISGIGFLIRYILVPGFKRNELLGRNYDLYFLGLDRHNWGLIHLILSISFIILVIIHVVLHWKQIVSMIKKLIKPSLLRIIIIVSIFSLVLFFLFGPAFINPEIKEKSPHKSLIKTP